ncbi:MAG: cell surface protein SprA, partial [Bacteroidaceae bacterium]|nr:cell surface protein SprA [Bacteroidaceae bacterium]
YTIQGCQAVWPAENMLDIDFSLFTNLKHNRNKDKTIGKASYTELYYTYDENNPNNKVSIIGNPSLGEVKTMMIGVRNNGRKTGGVEVWVNELRMQDYTNDGGWAAQGNLNVQLSDLGSVNVTGHVETAGFGGLEDGVNDRRNDNLYEWGITTQIELGKFFPEKWRMTLPLYYSYSWQKLSPKYNPFDTDMLLKDALDECTTSAARDSLSNLAETVVKNKNFSMSNWRSGVQSRKPMPYDPANFAFSYSYSQRYKTGETTTYENEENWKLNISYNYAPKYKVWEPFKNVKGKSKWLDILKAQNLQWLPQSIAFNTDLTRNYYEFQERDIDAATKLPVSFSDLILWNRDLTVKWDIFKSLKMSWTSSTHAEIEEPNTVVNKSLYPDEYAAWKDSVVRSLKSFGRPLTYK